MAGHWFAIGSLSCRCSVCGCKSGEQLEICPNCKSKMVIKSGKGMKRIDKLKKANIHEVAKEFCDEILKVVEYCESCPFYGRCEQGHNGVFDFLDEEVKE